CHGGAVLPKATSKEFNRRVLSLNPSVFTLAASAADEESWEFDKLGGGHGAFTYYVTAGLSGEADTSGDGIVSAQELADYVKQNVAEFVVENTPEHALQHPASSDGVYDPGM